MDIEALNESLMYTDTANIYRYLNVTNPDKSVTQKLQETPALSNVPCRLSIKRNDEPKQGNGVDSLTVVYTLFTSNLRTFKKGDLFKVWHKGKEYKLIAAEPMSYEFNQQIPMIQEDWV